MVPTGPRDRPSSRTCTRSPRPTAGRWNYFATFEFPDGSREEFRLQGEAYGLLSEGDSGLLRTQGTWFQGFDRNSQIQDRRN